jgi:N-methylhydantoinase B
MSAPATAVAVSARVADPVTLEVIRNRLQAITREMSATIVRTAVSTVISEARDFSCTVFDAGGNLVCGAATVLFHFGVVGHAARTILDEYGAEIEPGDLFIANDPHHGGGLHAQDVILLKPIFDASTRIGWAGASGHMVDVGGMVPGSFAPSARECFQEALRLPPTKLFHAGALDRGLWRVILNNVRMSETVSMDLMALVAGLNVADQKVRELRSRYGATTFDPALAAIQDLSEAECRRRIGELPAGEYGARGWTEFGDEFFPVVCTLRVRGGELVFDYAGSAPQCPYFFNSKPAIVESELIIRVHQILTPDVPFTHGVLRPVRIEAAAGSIIDAQPPAPIGAAHMHVGLLAMELGETSLKKALACSRSPRRERITGQGGTTGLGNTSWSWRDARGKPDAMLLMDGNGVGAGARLDRDGINLTGSNYGGPGLVYPDVEIMEQSSPMLVLFKRLRTDSGGAGRFRGGASYEEAFAPYGIEEVEGTLFGMRRHLPVGGLFGGYPGATTRFERIAGIDALARLRSGADLGRRARLPRAELLANNTGGIRLRRGEVFVFGCASGGGVGDPLDREPARVVQDLARGYISRVQAERVYGVIVRGKGFDRRATASRRRAIARARLRRATRPEAALQGKARGADAAGALTLTVAVVREAGKAPTACCGRCRRRLARAPDSWKKGAAIAQTPLGPGTTRFFVAPVTARRNPRVVLRELFCPSCATLLEAEVVLEGTPIESDVRPDSYAAAT